MKRTSPATTAIRVNQNDLPSPRYHDVFAKLQRTLSPKHALTFDALHARDKYTFDAPATTGFQDSLRTRENAHNTYGNSYLWTTLNSSVGARASARTQLSAGLVTRSRSGFEQYVDIQRPLYEDRLLVFPDRSRARGLEVYFSRDLGRRLALRASYSLSLAEEDVSRIENVNSPEPLTYATTHPDPQDQRHAANLDFITNHGNIFGYDYSRAFDANGNLGVARENAKWFTILPSIGVSWSN